VNKLPAIFFFCFVVTQSLLLKHEKTLNTFNLTILKMFVLNLLQNVLELVSVLCYFSHHTQISRVNFYKYDMTAKLHVSS
jgi:hypothetical protein